MKSLLAAAFAGVVALSANSSLAGEQTVKLDVDNLWCVSCAYFVRQALSDVDGVTAVEMSYREKTAIVTFDDKKTAVSVLTAATADVGFSSTAIE